MKVPDVSLRALRAIVTAVVVLDLVALLALSVHRATRTTTTVTPLAQLSAGAPATSAASAPLSAPPLSAGNPALPVLQVPTAGAVPAAVSSSVPVAPPASTASSTPPAPGTSPAAATCPIPLKAPADTGGLQSLIDFASAFGPFSAEAFAAASAYQPMLQLLGPLLAQYPKYAAQLQPVLDPLVHTLANLLNSGFTIFAPYYTPHRQQVLQTETKIAAALAPYAQKLASSPFGACLVDVEAALVSDTK